MRFLLRNWHLKLSAVLLATVLYTGLVFSGSFTDSTLEVRYRVANEQAAAVTAADIAVRVDLSAYDMERAPYPQQLPLQARSLRDGIEILTVEPETVLVQLDRVEVRSVPVEVDPGTVP